MPILVKKAVIEVFNSETFLAVPVRKAEFISLLCKKAPVIVSATYNTRRAGFLRSTAKGVVFKCIIILSPRTVSPRSKYPHKFPDTVEPPSSLPRQPLTFNP